MRYVIDRFEGNYAILECESGKDLVILKSKLPSLAKEGDVLICCNGIYTIDVNATNELKKRLNEKMKKLLKK